MTLQDLYSEEVQALCRHYRVKQLTAFGSLVKGGFGADSDIDLIVEFEPTDWNEYSRNYFGLKFALEDLFSRPVDLLEEKEIANPYFKANIADYKKKVYAS